MERKKRPALADLAVADWQAEAARRFGADPLRWAFTCPACGHVATVADYKAAGAPEGAVAFSCVGRWSGVKRDAFGLNPEAVERGELPPADGPGPCNYTGGGLFNVNPQPVRNSGGVLYLFAFADAAPPAAVGRGDACPET